MRIVIAEDSVLLRAGLTRILADAGEDVVATVGDADELLLVANNYTIPDLAIIDVRMPPNDTDDGLRAVLQIRAEPADVGILGAVAVRRGALRHAPARRQHGAVGYLLKDRISDVSEASLARSARRPTRKCARPGGRRGNCSPAAAATIRWSDDPPRSARRCSI